MPVAPLSVAPYSSPHGPALERISFALFVAALAWAPFPLGSNRPWSWSILCLVIVVCWVLWCASTIRNRAPSKQMGRALFVPVTLGVLALMWGVMQTLPFVPAAWVHPIWRSADSILAAHHRAAISLAPWQTGTGVMKLASYGLALLLARVFAARADRANLLLNVLIAVTAIYATYAFVLAAIGVVQYNVFYAVPAIGHGVSGPFVNRNSFATYAGLGALCAGVKLVSDVSSTVGRTKTTHRFVRHLLNYILGRGAPVLMAALVTVSALIATVSRAGNAAFVVGLVCASVVSAVISVRQSRSLWAVGVATAMVLLITALFVMNGAHLAARLDDLSASGLGAGIRPELWNAALRMIAGAPLLGLGLGTYAQAYPMYSDTIVQFTIDKAHNDYLELAAGWGLAASFLWWSAILWLVGLCVRGTFVRHRHLRYPVLAVGASALVGAHAIFDFSLQMPAVALTYATILGIGVAQAFRTQTGVK